jgi:hypothetical protein
MKHGRDDEELRDGGEKRGRRRTYEKEEGEISDGGEKRRRCETRNRKDRDWIIRREEKETRGEAEVGASLMQICQLLLSKTRFHSKRAI